MSGNVGEDIRALRDVLVVEPGCLALAGIDADDLLRRPHGQRLEDERVHETEDGRVAANGEGKRQDRHGREPRAASKQTHRELCVLPQFARESRHRSVSFHGPSLSGARLRAARKVAEFATRLCSSVRLGHAVSHQIVDAHVEVESELLLHVVVDVLIRPRDEAEEPFRVWWPNSMCHRRQAGSMTLKTASAYLFQIEISLLTCCRPAVVRP